MDDMLYPDPEDIEFSRSAYAKLYYSGEAAGVNPIRWERVRNDIRIEDVVFELTKKNTQAISCPFHGRDSRPSFYVYRRTNDCWCFGCPPRQQYYDAVRFTSKLFNFSRVKALIWLEHKFELPPIEDVLSEKEDDTVSLSFEDLREPFLQKATQDIITTKDPELAMEYLRLYFESEHDKAAIPLASVLGKEVVSKLAIRKGFHG
jgi:hypothetical protein